MSEYVCLPDGRTLHVERHGDGPPLLLIMGMGGNTESWGNLPALLPGREVICVDHPGMGRSPAGCSPRSMTGLADMYADLLCALGHDQADVLGYSFGGAVAQELARHYPFMVDRLILAATVTCPWLPNLSTISTALATLHAARDYRGRWPSPIGLAHQAWAITGWSSLAWLHEIVHETLVIAGENDGLVPVGQSWALAAGIPDASLRLIPDAGHLFLAEQPERAAPVLRGFLAYPPSAAATSFLAAA